MKNKLLKFTIPTAIVATLAIGGITYSYVQKDTTQKTNTVATASATTSGSQEKPEFMDFYDPTFEQISSDADLIVYGQIKKFDEKKEVNISGPSEDALKAKLASKGTSLKLFVDPVEIEVKQAISGDAPSTITLIRNQTSEEYEPELSVGDKMVFFLKKVQGQEDTYKVMHPQATYLHVLTDNKIKPEFDKFKDMSGETLDDLIVKIKQARDGK